jgi:hypothetical protein
MCKIVSEDWWSTVLEISARGLCDLFLISRLKSQPRCHFQVDPEIQGQSLTILHVSPESSSSGRNNEIITWKQKGKNHRLSLKTFGYALVSKEKETFVWICYGMHYEALKYYFH